jgi:hypothetical protein
MYLQRLRHGAADQTSALPAGLLRLCLRPAASLLALASDISSTVCMQYSAHSSHAVSSNCSNVVSLTRAFALNVLKCSTIPLLMVSTRRCLQQLLLAAAAAATHASRAQRWLHGIFLCQAVVLCSCFGPSSTAGCQALIKRGYARSSRLLCFAVACCQFQPRSVSHAVLLQARHQLPLPAVLPCLTSSSRAATYAAGSSCMAAAVAAHAQAPEQVSAAQCMRQIMLFRVFVGCVNKVL